MSIIRLKSMDEDVFEVEAKVVRMSVTLATMLDDMGSEDDGEIISLPKISSEIMKLVIDWATYRIEHPVENESDDSDNEETLERRTDNIDPWDMEFLKPLNTATLFELLMACNYLHIKGLMNATAKTVANMIKGKSPREIREVFHVNEPEYDNNAPSEDDAVVR